MKKRGFICRAVLICVASFFCLSGCNTKKDFGLSKKNPEEIKIWHYYNGAQEIAFEELIAEFNSTVGMEKGVIVSAESKSSIDELNNELMDSVKQRVGSENLPDICQSYMDTAIKLEQQGVLADLSPYITKEELEQYVPAYIEEGYLGEEGEWKLFPIAKSTEVISLNKTDWETFTAATGIQLSELSTWEGIAAVAEKYYEYSGGKSFFGRDAFANYMIIGSKQMGVELFDIKDGRVTLNLNKEVMRRLWDNYYIPYIKGYYKHVGRYRTDDVKLGEIIACAGSTSSTVYFPKEVTNAAGESYPIEHLILPMPVFEGGENYIIQQGASMAVVKSTPQKEYASVLFLKWFTQRDRNIQYAIQSGYMPVIQAANDMELINTYAEQNQIKLTSLEKDTLAIGIQQIQTGKLYQTKGFANGYEAREVLEYSMKDLAVQNRDLVLEAMEAGMEETEAIAKYTEDAVFEEWYKNIGKELMELCR